jgi:asparagine synthase (glutamine-hydrolysing)
MCGLAALIALPPAPLADAIRAMTTLVRHRGPDDEGYALFDVNGVVLQRAGGDDTPPECFASAASYAPREKLHAPDAPVSFAMGHRRLSILDVSAAGHQPMCCDVGRYWIIYNGEIYNYLELREELRVLGHAFRTQTDTEVILAAYRQWGKDCLHRFNGMFALLIYDREASRLFAARDRFGVKPLYYWRSPAGLLAFASEIKQFTVLPGWHPRAHPQRCYDMVNWNLLDHTHETCFLEVHQLRNGEALELELEGAAYPAGTALPTYSWYSARPQPFEGTLDDATQRFALLFTDSVALRLRADVPVGSCLSGGLDSSSIVCVLSELLRTRGGSALQKTFSACTRFSPLDERFFIERVTAHTGAQSHCVYPEPAELFEVLDDLVWHQDEPFNSTSIYAQWHVFRLARAHGVKVMLDGQGADESLGGYHSYFAPLLTRLLLRMKLGVLHREIRALGQVHGYSLFWAVKHILNTLLPEVVRQPLRALSGKASAALELIDIDRLGASAADPYLAVGGAKCRSMTDLSRAQLSRTHVQMLLHWEDRTSMMHSIEARVPFLDYRLVEFALGLPDSFKVADGMTKRILREAMKGTLPEAVRHRTDKLGFVTPEALWLTREASQQFRSAVLAAIDASNGVVTGRALERVDAIIAGKIPFDTAIWRVISFGRWLRRFTVSV